MLRQLAPATLAALNHLLREQRWARERLAEHAGRSVNVLLPHDTAPPWRFCFSIDETGLLALAETERADVELELPADLPLRVLLGREGLLGAVQLRGAADLAEALNFVMPRLRWDIEEDLSKLVGDIAAHRLVQGAQGIAAWQRQASERLGQNLADYLSEEQPLLVKKGELANFSAEVAALRKSLESLQERCQRLASMPPLA